MRPAVQLLSAVLVAALMGAPAEAQLNMKPKDRFMLAGQYGDVAIVNVPAFAGEGQEILLRVCRGTCVEVTETKSDARVPAIKWNKVRIASGRQIGTEGWVSSRYVVKDDGTLDNLLDAARPEIRSYASGSDAATRRLEQIVVTVDKAKTLKQPIFGSAELAQDVKAGECLVVVERKADPALPATEWCRVKPLNGESDKGWLQSHKLFDWQWGRIANRTGETLLVYGPARADDPAKKDNSLYRLPDGQRTPKDWDCDGFFIPKGSSYSGHDGPRAVKYRDWGDVTVTAMLKPLPKKYLTDSSPMGVFSAREINWPIPDINEQGGGVYPVVPRHEPAAPLPAPPGPLAVPGPAPGE